MAGRKKLPPVQPGTDVDIVEKTPPGLAETAAIARDAGMMMTLDEIASGQDSSKLVGQIRTAMFVKHVSGRVIAAAHRELTESAGYRNILVPGPDGERKRVSTYEEFCPLVFGMSARRIRQIAENDTLMGELYEAAESMGLRQRDFNALKTLPPDDQETFKSVIADGGDRDAAVGVLTDLVERMAAKNAKANADNLAKDDYIAGQKRTIEAKTTENNALRNKRAAATPDETLEQLRHQLRAAVLGVEIALTSNDAEQDCLRNRVRDMVEHAQAHELDLLPELAGLFAQLERTLWIVRDEFGVPHAAVGDPEKEAAMTLGEAL